MKPFFNGLQKALQKKRDEAQDVKKEWVETGEHDECINSLNKIIESKKDIEHPFD